MPTLDEILTDIDDRYANVFSQEQKIRWLNQVQRDVFREIALPEILQFKTVPGMSLYTETEGIDFDLIDSVTVDGNKYDLKGINDTLDTYSYINVKDKHMALYPKPEKVMDVYVYYKKRPKTLIDLTETPELKEDYQEILKHGVFMIMALAMDDIGKHNNFAMLYNAELQKIKDDRKPSRDYKIEDVYGVLGGML